jgi:pyruvate/2-oxoglutarate dehydrogenase complex dihydrolipoamide acyltransferase (E2) component
MSESASILVPRENVNDESATLVVWEVADGTFVEVGRPVAQIETSKAVVEILAPASGILRHEARAGQDVPIGAPIGRIGEAETPSTTNGSTPHIPSDGPGLPLAPSVRRLVAEGGVDPAMVAGTGRGGRITKGDVVAYLASNSGAEPPPPPRSTRFSRKARERLVALGLDESSFEGRGLIRVQDLDGPAVQSSSPLPPGEGPGVRAVASPLIRQESSRGDHSTGGAPHPGPLPGGEGGRKTAPVAASGVAVRSEPLSRAKRTEAKYLRSGFESTLASVVTVACPTRGFRAAFGADATALVVFEVARLLRKYPAFNAYHDDGVAYYYDEVNVGFAVDAGKGLKVPIVREADRKGVDAIGSEMRDLVVGYLGDALPVEALSGGTFTLTDLSGEGVVAFHPLINRGQSAILGLCAEAFPAGGREGTFNLVLAFDHQLAEGRAAARFLGDLRDRLASHEASALAAKPTEPGSETPVEEPRCSRCLSSYSVLAADGHPLVQTVRGDGSIRLLCKLCFEGWT